MSWYLLGNTLVKTGKPLFQCLTSYYSIANSNFAVLPYLGIPNILGVIGFLLSRLGNGVNGAFGQRIPIARPSST